MSEQIITDPAQWRAGDRFEGAYVGHPFSGELWMSLLGRIYAGNTLIRWENGTGAGLITGHVVRTVPDLPTEPGSVILATRVNGISVEKPVPMWCALDASWGDLTEAFGAIWFTPRLIEQWVPADVVPAGDASS